MSTDRELLELAAKAIGMEKPDGFHPVAGFVWIKHSPHRHETRWNPLTDDGDALRLAVKLGIEIGNFNQYGRALALIGMAEFWETGGDPYAATRRAIVRAATGGQG